MPDSNPRSPFVVTAGPTREFLDPVRFLSNPSTGKMGFAVAAAAARRGHPVTLIAGPVSLKTPRGCERVDVVSARDMLAAAETALAAYGGEAVFVATAAVADWCPATCAAQKLKKSRMDGTLQLVRNPDVLKSVRAAIKVGFAAETERVLDEARRKCREKGLAFIVANDVTEPGSGFASDTNRAALVYGDGRVVSLPRQSKKRLGTAIVRACEDICP